MLCQTIGIKYNTGYIVPLYMSRTQEVTNNVDEKCYSITLFETDGILLCLNERDTLPKHNPDAKIINIFFHPTLLNSILSYQFINTNILDSPSSEQLENQDMYLLRPFIIRNETYQGKLALSNDVYNLVLRLLLRISIELTEQIDIYWPCRSRSYLLELLLLISRQIERQYYKFHTPEGQGESKYIAEELLQYLHNNYTEKITLEVLATKFTTNRTTINHIVHKATGYSIIDYIIHLRVNLACIMLRNTRIPISEVMHRTGFNDNSNFWRAFKKQENLSPKEYRDRYCVQPL